MTIPARLPLVHRLPQSLTARLGLFVFAATLLSSMAVAWTSTRAVESFLRGRIEEKLPSLLLQTRSRVGLWFSQRQLDLQVFARSSIVSENLRHLVRSPRAQSGRRARGEIDEYLRYVLERFPQYSALFLMDARGHTLLWVGEPLELAADALAEVAEVREVSVVPGAADGSPLLVVSANVGAPQQNPLGSLHGVMRLDSLNEQLRTAELGESGRALLVDARGVPVAGWPPPVSREPVVIPEIGEDAPAVRDYTGTDGERVVGSALPFGRFDWVLVFEEPYDEAFAAIGSILRRTLGLNFSIILLLSLVAFRVATSIARPVLALADCARRLRDGEMDVTVPEAQGRDEVGDLTRAFSEMITALREARAEVELKRAEIERANERLRAQNEELQRANEVLEQLAITDGLTRLHNHRFFQDQLTREIKRCERTRTPLSLVLVDIDDFKKLNDTHGHVVGDAVLKGLAEVLARETRDHDLVSRYGGEEFAILAPDTDLEGAVALAEKLRTAVSATAFDAGDEETLGITVSVGVAIYRGDRAAFFHEADRALYDAKAAGKDCVVAGSASTSRRGGRRS